MTILTAPEVAAYWEGAGGPKSRIVEWCAISMGESSFDTSAVSSAGAIGLWQIMPFNAGPYGYTPQDLYDPSVNASVAVQMSGHGVNCAAWDSCYTDIEASGRLSFLSWPQVGSADYNNLTEVAALLGGKAIQATAATPEPTTGPSLMASLANVDKLLAYGYPSIGRALANQAVLRQHMFRPGWRP